MSQVPVAICFFPKKDQEGIEILGNTRLIGMKVSDFPAKKFKDITMASSFVVIYHHIYGSVPR